MSCIPRRTPPSCALSVNVGKYQQGCHEYNPFSPFFPDVSISKTSSSSALCRSTGGGLLPEPEASVRLGYPTGEDWRACHLTPSSVPPGSDLSHKPPRRRAHTPGNP